MSPNRSDSPFSGCRYVVNRSRSAGWPRAGYRGRCTEFARSCVSGAGDNSIDRACEHSRAETDGEKRQESDTRKRDEETRRANAAVRRRTPAGNPSATACARSRAPSLRNSRRAWVLTVSSDRNNSRPISPLDWPWLIPRRTCISRSVSGASRRRIPQRRQPRRGQGVRQRGDDLGLGGVPAQEPPRTAGDGRGDRRGVVGRAEDDHHRRRMDGEQPPGRLDPAGQRALGADQHDVGRLPAVPRQQFVTAGHTIDPAVDRRHRPITRVSPSRALRRSSQINTLVTRYPLCTVC